MEKNIIRISVTMLIVLTSIFAVTRDARAGLDVSACPDGCQTAANEAGKCGGSAPNWTCTATASTSSGSGQSKGVTFTNPIGPSSVSALLGSLLANLQGIIALVAIVFVVIGAVMYMASAGDDTMIKRAKAIISGALIGLAIALAAPAFLKEILSILQATDSSGTLANAISITDIAKNVLRFLLSITGVIAIIFLVIGGLMYLTSYGDQKRIDKGKEIMTASIIGITIAIAALVIVKEISSLLAK